MPNYLRPNYYAQPDATSYQAPMQDPISTFRQQSIGVPQTTSYRPTLNSVSKQNIVDSTNYNRQQDNRAQNQGFKNVAENAMNAISPSYYAENLLDMPKEQAQYLDLLPGPSEVKSGAFAAAGFLGDFAKLFKPGMSYTQKLEAVSDHVETLRGLGYPLPNRLEKASEMANVELEAMKIAEAVSIKQKAMAKAKADDIAKRQAEAERYQAEADSLLGTVQLAPEKLRNRWRRDSISTARDVEAMRRVGDVFNSDYLKLSGDDFRNKRTPDDLKVRY